MKKEPSPILKNCIWAFCVGGAICALGEGLRLIYINLGMTETDAPAVVSVTLVFAAAILTGLGIFDKLARHAGAGTLLPITGFANSVVSPAIDNKAEGWVMGVGAKIFIIAGPVILYGVLAGVVYGIIYFIMQVI
ncbi:MAG: SpoVA/SpoVAEb family sporulation membrane protein [Clostridia bacterium]|nr:SpoVA/SpoVAEb family sporulation membrane protein [Clostridia bacterium]